MAMAQFAKNASRSLGMRLAPRAVLAPLAPMGARLYSEVVDGLKYAKSHEWAKVDGDTVTIGITDHAQAALGDIVYVELPQPGDTVEAGSPFGVVESVKAASDVYSPVSGEVVASNDELADNSNLVNESPYEKGWFMKVKMSSPADLESMMDSAGYTAHCDE
eukprot:CAMPEP_0183789688 /NCGR_PEP_ID=MMETSP0803_2-20130417/575_1 /TAXON_ID=195967 /ORGANISM="Crustomastix stigmata, Strain CCMP3273" /LENGTH=161 /DNA_ID=CAMNT_0026033865 /DNA_START=42 /DNA_END=527 /DNA_ORIENTATION=+